LLILKEKNISICYETFGKPTNPCVILVMGITAQLIHWPTELTQGLANADFQVITFDNRDVGLSSYYDHLETPSLADAITIKEQGKLFKPPYTLNDMAQDIITLMDGLKIKNAHIIGISMGGQIAQIFALEHPERILSLTLIATSNGDPKLPPPKPEVLDFFFMPNSSKTDPETSINQHLKQYKLYNHPDDINIKMMRKLHEKAYQRAYHPEGNQRQLLAMMFTAPWDKKINKIQIPSLVIHGNYDPVVPLEHGKQLAKCLPNSRLEIIENMGHGIPERVYLILLELLKEHLHSVPHNDEAIGRFNRRN